MELSREIKEIGLKVSVTLISNEQLQSIYAAVVAGRIDPNSLDDWYVDIILAFFISKV